MSSTVVSIVANDFAGSDPQFSGVAVTANMFGGCYTGYQSRWVGLGGYVAHADEIGAGNIRWPGGTFAKSSTDTKDWDQDGDTTEFAYDLGHRDICLKADFAGSDFGLSGVLQAGVSKGVAVSMIVPVDRHYGDPATGSQGFEAFLSRLLITRDFGVLPSTLILEFGNEDVPSGDVAAANNYAQTVDTFLSTYRTFVATHDVDVSMLRLGVQAGGDLVTDQIIRDGLSLQNYGQIDQMIVHSNSLNIRNGQINGNEYNTTTHNWSEQFGSRIEFNASEWAVGDSNNSSYQNELYADVGAAQARTALDTFTRLASFGFTWSAIWGLDVGPSPSGLPTNPNWMSSGSASSVELSHGGEVFRLMSEVLPGTALLNGLASRTQSGALINGDFPGLPDYALQAFQGSARLVIFIAANYLQNGPTSVKIDLSDFGIAGQIEKTDMTTVWNDPAFKYDDVPQITSSFVAPVTGLLTVDLTDHYEFVRLVVPIDVSNAPVITSVAGTAGADSFAADFLALQMVGGLGNDTYVFDKAGDAAIEDVNGGIDTIVTSGSVDLTQSSAEIENVEFLGANATFVVGNALDNRLSGNDADNQLFGALGNDTLLGNLGDDTLDGGDGTDTLCGGSDNDLLSGGAGNDLLDGGSGSDTVTFVTTSAVTVSLRAGTAHEVGSWADRLISIEHVIGGSGSDMISGDGVGNSLAGNLSNDTLYGGAGDDSLFGGDGSDVLFGEAGNDLLSGGAGSDTVLYSGTEAVTVDLSSGLVQTVRQGRDQLLSIESVRSGSGADRLIGDSLANTLVGNLGDDTLEGGDGADWLYGGADNDLLIGGNGSDVLDGGTGSDTAVFLTASPVTVSLRTGTAQDASGADRLIGIEHIATGDGADQITGDAFANSLTGNLSNDTIYGGAGTDSLFGGDGSDVLFGEAGDDLLNGGAGNDTVLYLGIEAVSVDLASGIVRTVTQGTDQLIGIESVRSGSGGDILIGDAAANTLVGNLGDDTLDSGAGADWLYGGADNDRLLGGAGNDVLDGGTGRDEFIFTDGFGFDRITDFVPMSDILIFDLAQPATAQLDVVSTSLGVSIGFDGSSVLLAGITADQLDWGAIHIW